MNDTTTLERITLCVPKPLLDRIDRERDLAPRSPFVCRLLSKALDQHKRPAEDIAS